MKKFLLIYIVLTILLISDSFSQTYTFNRISAQYSGKDAWKSWWIDIGSTSGTMKTVFSGNDAWSEWDINLQINEGTIRTMFAGENAWTYWQFTLMIAPGILKLFIRVIMHGKSGKCMTDIRH